MLSGKAVSRAVCGHMLVDAALHALLMEKTFNIPLPLEESQTNTTDDEYNEQTPSQMNSAASCDKMERLKNFAMSCYLKNVQLKMLSLMKSFSLSNLSSQKRRTHLKLFALQPYGYNICIMSTFSRHFVNAERTGNWNLHLQAIQKMSILCNVMS